MLAAACAAAAAAAAAAAIPIPPVPTPAACDTCPWGRAELGAYPPPFNAPEGFRPVHRGKYFDVYGHWMETRYSEVFWTAQPAVPLPADIVEEYKGRAISFTGFEVDVVAGGENDTTEWSIPEFEIYNHHYCATVRGAKAKMVRVGRRAQDSFLRDESRRRRRAIEVHPAEWEPRDLPGDADAGSPIPTAQNFWQGNGGEHRRTFKHFPRGTGQLIDSPEEFILQPMLINTRGPMKPGQSPRAAFHDAPLPRSSRSPPGANYSGLMECPCTTRTVRKITGFVTKTAGTCAADGITDAARCFAAAASIVGAAARNVSAPDPAAPAGCFVISHADGYDVHFNTAASAVECGAGDGPVRAVGSEMSENKDLTLRLDLDSRSGNATITLTGPAAVWFGVGFGAASMADAPYTITVDGSGAVGERRLANHMPGTPLPATVDVVSSAVGPAPPAPPRAMNHRGAELASVAAADWPACERACAGAGACAAWTYFPPAFTTPYNLAGASCRLRRDAGRGFTAEGWADGVMSGERARGAVRTVVLRRALRGATEEYYTFDPRAAAVPFIEAVGTTPAFQYHGKSRGGGHVMLVEVGAPVCVCRGAEQGGTINGIPWANNCEAYPATTIARDHNPSCSIETYGGGMICCHHGIHLLDADQDIPPEPFRFRMKFRFYYEDPAPIPGTVAGPGAAYQNAFFMFRETEVAHGEYDVTKCPAGTPPAECVHTVVGRFQVKEAMHECKGRSDVWCSPSNGTYPQSQRVAFVHISPHCHGPACISMEMVNADTNATICYVEPHYGTTDQAMNEAGYAAGIPPCIWGAEGDGLPPPPVVSLDTNITVIKRANATVKHYGVMGHWQMRAIWA